MKNSIEGRYPSTASGFIGTGASVGGLLMAASTTLHLWYERHRQRRHLARLDERLLRDIGIDRASAELEIAKPFWRP